MAISLRINEIFFSLFRRGRNFIKGESLTLDSLYRKISYRFKDEILIRQALTHRSLLADDTETCESNERLEFLGDAVLGMIVTDELYNYFPDRSEGQLTKAKSRVVSRETLAKRAKKIGLGHFLLLGAGEEKSGGRDRHSILSDAYEALIGAMYLDGGMDEVRRFVCQQVLVDMDRLFEHKFHYNYKSWLLEYVQAKGSLSPEYAVLKESGPDHKKEFTVEVLVDGTVLGMGKGFSKKTAEQQAARKAIEQLGLKGETGKHYHAEGETE
jgi:ribonuclease-3